MTTCRACTGNLPHLGCTGFEGGYNTYHCACYLRGAAANPEMHPNAPAAEDARRVAQCKATGAHRPVSIGFNEYWCGSCGWVGKKEAVACTGS